MTVAELLSGQNIGQPMLVASSATIRQYRAPPAVVGVGPARSVYRRCICFSAQYDVDLTTDLRIPHPPVHPSQ